MAELFKRKKKEEEENSLPDLQDFAPKAAAVNLIPRGVLSKYRVTKIRNRFVGAVVTLIVVLGGVFGYNLYETSGEDVELLDLEAQANTLREQAKILAPYQTFYTKVENKRIEISEKMITEITTGDIFETIYEVAGQTGVKLNSVNLNVAGQGSSGRSSSCPSPDPWGSFETIGCISFEGNTSDRDNIANFVNMLNDTPGFINAYVPSSNTSSGSESGPGVSSVSGTVSFDALFYTLRWIDLDQPLSQLIEGESAPEGTEETEVQEGTEEAPSSTDDTTDAPDGADETTNEETTQ